MITLQQLYEEFDGKIASYRIIVAGADITERVSSFEWQFSIGEVPTASFSVPSNLMVPAIAEEAFVEIWFGFKLGMVEMRKLVFGGGVIDSVSYSGHEFQVECIQDGARRLNYPYYKQVDYDFDNVIAQDAVTALLNLAGVPNFHVDLDPWDIGTAVPQTLKFSTYGDAINKVATVDGTPWFALPTGQIRVEKRDPLPYDTPKRTYYSGSLNGIAMSQPPGVFPINPNANPRVVTLSKHFDRAGVNNFINIDGATLETLGPNGERNSEQIHEEVDAAPGDFVNGAPWITTPPLFQPFTYSNELIDTNAKANAVANRYLLLKNRLIQEVSLQIPCDPELFLCMTVKVIDEDSRTQQLYFLQSYRCSVSEGGAVSELSLLGGQYAGTQGFASPFAEFRWTYDALWRRYGGNGDTGGACAEERAQVNKNWGASMGAKLCQDLPADVGSADKGGGSPVVKFGQVWIAFDGSWSEDFDGQIVSWEWSDDVGHSGTGKYITFVYDPEFVSSVQVTLTVTDDTARTDTITKTVYTSATAPLDPLPPNPTLNDTPQGGGEGMGDCTAGADPNNPDGNGTSFMTFAAAECAAMGTSDHHTWNKLTRESLSVGKFVGVAAATRCTSTPKKTVALFGTDEGEIVRTEDGAQTGEVVHRSGKDESFKDILFDSNNCGSVIAISDKGSIYKSTDDGVTWKQVRPSDGITVNKAMEIDGKVYLFGGDSSDPDNMIRVASSFDSPDYKGIPMAGFIRTAINGADPGTTITSAAVTSQGMMIGFSGGMSNNVWNTTDISTPGNWTAAEPAVTSGVRAMAAGPGSESAVATDDGVLNSGDNENFTPGCPTPLNDITSEGLSGVYMGADESGEITKIVDDTCGPMPTQPDNTPPCPIRQIKNVVGPCPPPPGEGWPDPIPIIIPPVRREVMLSLTGNGINVTSVNGGVIFAFHDGASSQPGPSSAHIGAWIPVADVELYPAIAAHPASPCFLFDPTPAASARIFAGVVPPGSNFTYDGSGYGVEVFADNADMSDPVDQIVQQGPFGVYSVDEINMAIGILPPGNKILAFLSTLATLNPGLTPGGAVTPMGSPFFIYVASGNAAGSWHYFKDDQSPCDPDYNVFTWVAFGISVQGSILPP